MTDHGSFVVFNCYVPNSGQVGARVPYKQRWLAALHRAMQKQRAKGKAVVWAGDLNMKLRTADSHFLWRSVNVPKFVAAVALLATQQQQQLKQQQEHQQERQGGVVLAEASASAFSTSSITPPPTDDETASATAAALPLEVKEFAARLGKEWGVCRRRLLAKEHKQLSYKNAQGQMVPKWRVLCNTARDDQEGSSEKKPPHVLLGKPMWSEAEAQASFCVRSRGVTEAGEIVFGSDGGEEDDGDDDIGGGGGGGGDNFETVEGMAACYRLNGGDCLCMDDLCEVLEKVCGWAVPLATQRAVANFLDSKALSKAYSSLACLEPSLSSSSSSSSQSQSSSLSSSSSSSSRSSLQPPTLSSSTKPMISLETFIGGHSLPPHNGTASSATAADAGAGAVAVSPPPHPTQQPPVMVDAFSHFHPTAQGRATCWHQQMNCRYDNCGGRIGKEFLSPHISLLSALCLFASGYESYQLFLNLVSSPFSVALFATDWVFFRRAVGLRATSLSLSLSLCLDYTIVDQDFFEQYALRGDPGHLDCGLLRPSSITEEGAAAVGSSNSSSVKTTSNGGDGGASALENDDEARDVTAVATLPSEESSSGASTGVAAAMAAVVDPNSRQAALAACTLSGVFKAVPMTGGGMVDSPQWAYDHHLNQASTSPHTGIVYTPPQYSDHVGVSLLLKSSALDAARAHYATAAAAAGGGTGRGASSSSSSSAHKFDSETRKCQPHASTSSITSFFSKASAPQTQQHASSFGKKRGQMEASSESSSSSSTQEPPPKVGLRAFFATKST
jgi:hypothetical protein